MGEKKFYLKDGEYAELSRSKKETAQNTIILTNNLFKEYKRIRSFTVELLNPLSSEDTCGQSMPDCSPAKWHAAHTTWFFETFILADQENCYSPFDPSYEYLFNSYYNSVGKQYPRADRGLITRPSLEKVLEYRDFIDCKMYD